MKSQGLALLLASIFIISFLASCAPLGRLLYSAGEGMQGAQPVRCSSTVNGQVVYTTCRK